MPEAREQTQPNSTGLVSDVLRERTAAQLAQLDGLDTKAASALGFAGVLLGLLFANSSIVAHWNPWMSAAVVILVASALALAYALWVRDWMVSPSDQDLRSWQGKGRGITEALLAAGLQRALAHNHRQTKRKALAIRIGLALIAAAIAVGAVGLMVARSDIPTKASPLGAVAHHPRRHRSTHHAMNATHPNLRRPPIAKRHPNRSHPGARTRSR